MDCYEYVLMRMGFSINRAKEICEEMLRNFGSAYLDEYIADLESDCYVD